MIKDVDLEKELKEKRDKQEVNKKLAINFNKEAQKMKSPYRIKIKCEKYPYLIKIKKGFLITNEIDISQLVYIEEEHYWVFSEGISLKTFKDIEKILLEISETFSIKLKDGDVPSKYEVINKLK